MRKNLYIRRITSFVLLATFALSNTPTSYLHFLFANHKDFVSKNLTESNSPQLSVTGINCHCETNVVVAPYTMGSSLAVVQTFPVFFQYPIPPIPKIDFTQYISFGLRGPPSFA